MSSTTKSVAQRMAEKRRREQAAAKIGEVLSNLVFIPILMTLLWNYGVTEVIQALGGPDADVGLLAGMLAVLFIGAIIGIIARKLSR